jgi:hypothetical protein
MSNATEFRDLLRPQKLSDHTNSEEIQLFRKRMLHAFKRMEGLVLPEKSGRVAQMARDLDDFSVRISMVGQVKAGKTALTNALIGKTNLLPSDVNPWTSVVTSVHINHDKTDGKDAVFTFYTSDEWSQMVNIGGHLGKMAARTNHYEEVVSMRDQIETMQSRAQSRLGHNFNLLLDSNHSFSGLSPELVKKYVCLGEEDDLKEGRYADVTKSADLYIQNDKYSLPTVVCDTPGVNDPFLLREAVTLNNLNDTDICVVVLSAHQAFSSVDIGLLRILMAMKHEQLVLYVNRVDELHDPDRQILEIDGYIRELLVEHDLPRELPIVFGSAVWAEMAATGETTDEFDASQSTLRDFATKRQNRLENTAIDDVIIHAPGSTLNTVSKTSDLSGLHELQNILFEKSALNVGRPLLEDLHSEALDVAQQSLVYFEEVSKTHSIVRSDLDHDAFFDELDTILKDASDSCTKVAVDLSDKVLLMMSSAFREFMYREKVGLKEHLDKYKDIATWQPDSERLRRDLNLAHDEFVELAPQRVEKVFVNTGAQVEVIYALVLDKDHDIFDIQPPKAREPKTPVSLMRTMAIDMGTGWFTGWFKSRFNKATYIDRFEELCLAEMAATLKEMTDTYVTSYERQVRAQLYVFLTEHMQTLHRLCGLSLEDNGTDATRMLSLDTDVDERMIELSAVVDDLKDIFELPSGSPEIISKSGG